MRKLFKIVFFLAMITGTTQAQPSHVTQVHHTHPQQHSPTNHCYYKGIDTCLYKIGYNHNGTLLVFTKDRLKQLRQMMYAPIPNGLNGRLHTPGGPIVQGEQNPAPPPGGGDLITPGKAVDMISNYIKPDVDDKGVLQRNMTRYVDFNIEKLGYFYTGRRQDDENINMLRIYFGKYSEEDGELRDRISLILVGCNNDDDIKDDTRPILSPVNMGTLCPVNCNNSDFGDDKVGDIYGKLGAKKAGATSRLP